MQGRVCMALCVRACVASGAEVWCACLGACRAVRALRGVRVCVHVHVCVCACRCACSRLVCMHVCVCVQRGAAGGA